MTTFPIPEAALEAHAAILGKTGSGKSNTAKVIVEGALRAGERVCVVDPTGTWFGLRLTPKRKPSGLDALIFGGHHADVPITAAHGGPIAEIVGTSATPAIIDTRLMTVADRTRFFTDFAETLLRKNSGQLRLVIDEAHLFMPQGKVNDPQSGKMLHAANNLVSLGRGIGLRIVMVSQRPAKVHKDALTQIETLIAMRLVAPQDRAAVGEWIKESADADQGRELQASLSSLPTGDAWVWSPQIDLLERVHMPLASTLDTGRPAEGDAVVLEPLDLKTVTGQLATIAEEAKANDPRALKAEIGRLKADLAKATDIRTKHAPVDPAALEAARSEGYAAGHDDGLEEGERRGAVSGQAVMLTRVRSALDAIRIDQAPEAEATVKEAPRAQRAPADRTAPSTAPSPQPARREAASQGDAALATPLRRILDAIAWWNACGLESPTINQVGFIAGYTPGGGTFSRYRSSLRSSGHIDYPTAGRIALSGEGVQAATAPDTLPSVDALHDAVRARIDGPLQKLLNPLLVAYPDQMAVAALAEASGYEAAGGTFSRYRSSLRSLELIEYPAAGQVRAADWLFPEIR